MYIQTKEPGAVSLWAFLHFVVLLRTDRGGPQQRIGNISRPAAAETCPPGRAKMEKGRFRMYDRKCDVDIRLLGCALVLLVMALLTIHTGLAKKAVTAAADPAPAAVVWVRFWVQRAVLETKRHLAMRCLFSSSEHPSRSHGNAAQGRCRSTKSPMSAKTSARFVSTRSSCRAPG